MTQRASLVDALKHVLRARGITYAKLAKTLKLSEASVKRIFATHSFTLERLDQVCEFVGIEISDLAKIVAQEGSVPERLTPDQEKVLVSDPKLLLVAVNALNHWTLEEIVENYAFSKPECIRLLLRLDKLKILDLLPNNKIRVRVSRNFAWLPNGPIQQYFQEQVQSNFFRSRFDERSELMVFSSGMLSRTSNAAIQSRMKRLISEFSELHHQDLQLPLSERFGTSILLALRPWMPDTFKKLRRLQSKRP